MAAEESQHLDDEILFQQPEGNHLGDCPICAILLPYDVHKCALQLCCSKVICKGCFIANFLSEKKQKLKPKCPFCREPVSKSVAKTYKNTLKRIKANDPVATFQFAVDRNKEGDYQKAFEYWTKAAELGDAESHFRLAGMYHQGLVVEKDEAKGIHHWEVAAVAGHPIARYNLGCQEGMNCNFERMVRHLIIAANQGHDGAMKALMDAYHQRGCVSKEELSATLRTHQGVLSEINTPPRVAAENSLNRLGLN